MGVEFTHLRGDYLLGGGQLTRPFGLAEFPSPHRCGGLLATLLGLQGLVLPRGARADLEDDLQALQRAWAKSPAKVDRAKAQLAERGQLLPVRIAPAALDIASEDCVTVAVLGAVSSQFVLRFLPTPQGPGFPEGEHPEQSAAGAAQLVRCGARKAMLPRLVVEMRSPRGVLEVLTATARRPVSALTKVLPSREPGAAAPFGRVGPRPNVAPVATRARGYQLAAERRGAASVQRKSVRPGPGGAADALLRLDPGCHEISVLASDPLPGTSQSDIDAELWRVPAAELGASDRTTAADAQLATCVGEPTTARLRVGSAPAVDDVTVLHARFDLPDGIRAAWGATARGRVAEALGAASLPLAKSPPIDEALLISGVTLLPISVIPGRCYVAAIAAVRGRALGIAMSAMTGAGRAQNQSDPGAAGTSLAFCATRETQLIEVEARGSGTTYLFALWAAGSHPLGAD